MTDRVTASRRRVTDAGDLVADAVFARIGVQEYTAAEVQAADRSPSDVLRVYRPASEVFRQDTMDSFRSVPVTNNHPRAGLVTKDNVSGLRVGMTGDEVKKTKTTIDGTVQLTDADAVASVNGGKVELSAGYSCVYDFTPGETADGEAYDAIQRDIEVNHIAMVTDGRCGPVCTIADSGNCNGDCADCPHKRAADMKTITIDGKKFELEDAVAKAVQAKIKKLTKDAEEAEKKAEDMEEEKAKAGDEEEEEKKAKDNHTSGGSDPVKKKSGDAADAVALAKKELAKAEAQRDEALERVLTPDALDALVEARAQLVTDAVRLHPKIEISGKTNEDIRREVVVEKTGQTFDGKSDAYIEARFDAMAEGGGESERFRSRNLDTQKAKDGAKGDDKHPTRDQAYSAAVVDIQDHWRGEKKSA